MFCCCGCSLQLLYCCLAFGGFKGVHSTESDNCDLLDPRKLACFCDAGPVDGRLQDGPDMQVAGDCFWILAATHRTGVAGIRDAKRFGATWHAATSTSNLWLARLGLLSPTV